MKTQTDYLALLAHSYDVASQPLGGCITPENRLEYLSMHVFEFTTYDGDMDTFFARRAVETCKAITTRTIGDYIAAEESYRWFLAMCNMSFFEGRLDWGSSIRGAWWDHDATRYRLGGCGFYQDGEPILDVLTFSREEWVAFIEAVIEFAEPELAAAPDGP